MPRTPKTPKGKHYAIRCAACRAPILLYQKDGPGSLQRMYLDRIRAPEALAALVDTVGAREDTPPLTCPACRAVIATPMQHAASGRLAFRVMKGRLIKQQVTSEDWPPED